MARNRWYNINGWKARRDQQLREEPLCRYCQDMGRVTPATVADHVIPHRGDYDLFWHGELQSLCAECHSGPKQAEESRGQKVGCLPDGTPRDAGHHWNKM